MVIIKGTNPVKLKFLALRYSGSKAKIYLRLSYSYWFYTLYAIKLSL